MLSWDFDILTRVNHGWSHPFLDWLMPAASAIGAWLPFLLLIVVLVLSRGGARGRHMILCLAVALAVGDGLVSNTLKKAIGRVRPRDTVEGLVVRDLGPGKPEFMRLFQPPVQEPSKPRPEQHGKSFPSSHTVNMFAAATVVALFYRRWGLLLYLLAILVSVSRLYVAAHWPSDLPLSAALGILTALTSVWLVNRIRSRFTKESASAHSAGV